jgi:phospholipid/cholesterol/gamma-HCH transport system permease protein
VILSPLSEKQNEKYENARSSMLKDLVHYAASLNRVTETASNPNLVVERTSPEVLRVSLSGNWRAPSGLPGVDIITQSLGQSTAERFLEFSVNGLTGWDSRFVAFINRCVALCRERNMTFRGEGLPDGVRRLLRLANAVPEKKDARTSSAQPRFLQNLGEHAFRVWQDARDLSAFLGENILALVNLLRGRAQFRWVDALLVMQQCGPQALGIVALINCLIGLILAFVGAVELQRFGASIYVSDLVGIATVREMGCVMTGIIICGRTGAAFAAQLGTMKVNEEISALQTFGISPLEFLVLPRMVALLLMMPFLCVFADLISITGGFLVSASMLDISPTVYFARIAHAIQLKSFLLGIGKGSFFGFLIAFAGCFRGMQSGYSAAAVGEATTSAVVTGITAIVASDGLFAVLANALHI